MPSIILINVNPIVFLGNASLLKSLEKVEYSSRHALALFYKTPLHYPAVQQPFTFIRKSTSPIRYWAIEEFKRSGDGDKAGESGLVIHSCTDAENEVGQSDLSADESRSDCDKIQQNLVDAAYKEVLALSSLEESPRVILHRWKYSQVLLNHIALRSYFIIHRLLLEINLLCLIRSQ